MIIINIILFLLACLVLVKSSEWIAKSLENIAEYLKLNEFVIGFIVLAVATSLPELFIGVRSSLEGVPLLGLGTVIGSNIIALTLVIGISVLVGRGIRIREKTIRTDLIYMMAITVAPLILLLLGNGLSKIDGVILISLFAFYMLRVLSQKRRFKRIIDHVSKKEFFLSLFNFFMSILLLLFSAEFIVRLSSVMAPSLGLPTIFIGLFAVAFGTALPDLAIGIRGTLDKHEELVIGDIAGSVVVNITLVIGVIALLSKNTVTIENPLILISSAAFMVLIAFIFMTFAESEQAFSWKEGVSLILLYVFFIMIEFYIKMMVGA